MEEKSYLDKTIEDFLSKSPKYYGSEMNEFVSIIRGLIEEINKLGDGPADNPNAVFMLGMKLGWGVNYMEEFHPKDNLILMGLQQLKTMKFSHTTKNNITIKIGSSLKWWGTYYGGEFLEGIDMIKFIYEDRHNHIVAELDNKKKICIGDLDKTAKENLKEPACQGWELVD